MHAQSGDVDYLAWLEGDVVRFPQGWTNVVGLPWNGKESCGISVGT